MPKRRSRASHEGDKHWHVQSGSVFSMFVCSPPPLCIHDSLNNTHLLERATVLQLLKLPATDFDTQTSGIWIQPTWTSSQRDYFPGKIKPCKPWDLKARWRSDYSPRCLQSIDHLLCPRLALSPNFGSGSIFALICPIVTGSCSSSSMGFCGGFIVYLKIFRTCS